MKSSSFWDIHMPVNIADTNWFALLCKHFDSGERFTQHVRNIFFAYHCYDQDGVNPMYAFEKACGNYE